MMFLFFIPEISIAQEARLVPLFSITADYTDQKLDSPGDVFIDEKNSEIYILDLGNRRVVVFDMDGFFRYQFAIPSKLGAPSGLVLNDQDEILLAVGGKIAVCDFRGSFLEYVKLDDFPDAEKVKVTRLKIGKENNYYILDAGEQRVLVFDSDWNFEFAIDEKSLPNSKNLVNGKLQEAPMVKSLSISDIWTDDEGKIYLIDSMASYVFVFNNKGEYLRSIGEPGATFNTLSFPSGVAVDSQGRVLVVDTTGHALLGYNKRGRLLFALGGIGKSEGRFYFPKYVSTDKSGRIYVVEPFLNRIQVLTVESSF